MIKTLLTNALVALSLTLSSGLPAFASDQEVTLINVFEVPIGKLDASIAMWEQARDFLRQQPGYLSTALHRALLDDARFRLINVARWESAAAFMAASKRMRAEAGLRPIDGLQSSPALYTVIRAD
ncbi:MAG: antibiotic biosynthesis monooxygenase family protein [Pseudomonadota bacterium]